MTNLRSDLEEEQGRDQAKIESLHRYWLDKRGARRFPARNDIDPLEIPQLLSNIVLVDVLPSPERQFRFRLVGTAVVQLYGADFTGQTLDEIETGNLQDIIRAGYQQVLETSAPCFQQGDVHYQDRFWVHYRRIILPLGEREDRPDMLLAGVFFSWPAGKAIDAF